jgi:formylglycine-generating enzyme required for sulfatase activity
MSGPEPPGAGKQDKRDVVHLPGGDVWDLVGNVSQWARDMFQTYAEPCWSPVGIVQDPECNSPSKSEGSWHVWRGGGWTAGAKDLEAAARAHVKSTFTNEIGLRCARADQ